jgi:tRNA(Arg) A34 adenosine deaminase TadA
MLDTGSSGGKHTVVALGIRKGVVVSRGMNSYIKTHPMQKKLGRYPFLHAEVACLARAPKNIDTLFIARRDKRGKWVKANPCAVCSKAISLFNPSLKVLTT